jgi:probable HAF family extracellular repeat protein
LLPALACLCVAVTRASAGLDTHYRVIDLGGPPAGSGVFALSPEGFAAGYVLVGPSTTHAVVFEDGQVRDIGTLGGNASLANAVANGGRVAGWARLPGDVVRHAFLYSDGAMRDLGSLGGSVSNAFAVNDAGMVAGSSFLADERTEVPFLWTAAGGMRAIEVPPGAGAAALALNDQGEVAGFWADDGATIYPFVTHAGLVETLPSLGGWASKAYALSSSGEYVAGYSLTADANPFFHAVVWRNGQIHDFGALEGRHSGAFGVNDAGIVVGHSYRLNDVQAAVVFTDSLLLDLNTTIDDTLHWHLNMATGITNDGIISGLGRLDGVPRAFVLVPQRLHDIPWAPLTVTRLGARAFPMPLRGSGTLELDLPRRAHCRVALFDLGGRRVADLADGEFPAGRPGIALTSELLGRLGAGVYYARIDSDLGVHTQRLVVLR